MTTEQRAKESSSASILIYVYLLVALSIVISAAIAGSLIYGQSQARRVEQLVQNYHLATRLDVSRIEFELNEIRRDLVKAILSNAGDDTAEIDRRENARSAVVIGQHMRSIVAIQRRFAGPEFEAATQRLATAVGAIEPLMAMTANETSADESVLDRVDLVTIRCVQLDRLHAVTVRDKQALGHNESARARFVLWVSTMVGTGCVSILLVLVLATRAVRRRELAETRLAHRALEAESLYQAIAMANATDSFETALQECVDIVCRMTDWPVGHVYLPSKSDPNRLDTTDIWHLSDEQRFAAFREVTEQTSFVVGEGLPGRILKSGQPAWIVNVSGDDNFPRNNFGRDLGVKGAFGFPINIEGKIAAILEFFTDREMEEDEPLLLMVRSVGEQVGRVVERKAASEKLREMHARLTHVSRLSTMGEMVAGIAHEINQPLSAIANFALASKNTIEATNYKFDVPIEDWLQDVNEQAVRCGDIIRRLRNFVKKGDDDREWTDLNRVVLESIKLIESDIRHDSVVIDCQLPDTETLVHISQTELQQVIVNLLRNACDATTDTPTPRVSIHVERRGGCSCLTVEDNGHGVEESQRTKIFDTFFTTKPNGMGMGLAISKSIVEAHDGNLRLVPETASGATFHIELPTVEAATERIWNAG